MLNPQFVAGEHGLFGGHKSEDIRTFFFVYLVRFRITYVPYSSLTNLQEIVHQKCQPMSKCIRLLFRNKKKCKSWPTYFLLNAVMNEKRCLLSLYKKC